MQDKSVFPITNSHSWPLLLKNYESLNTKDTHYTPFSCGYSPYARPLDEYIKYGVINLDKSTGPSSHEIVVWVKNIINMCSNISISKTGHCGTLDPSVSGCLTVLLERATRLAKSGQSEGKEYVCVLEFGKEKAGNLKSNSNEKGGSKDKSGKTKSGEKKVKMDDENDNLESEKYKIDKKRLLNIFETLTGSVFQRPPLMCAVKRDLRLRTIYKIDLIEIKNNQVLFRVFCEAGTYVRTLCTHIGLLMGFPAYMKELRRTKSGNVTEELCFTLHDLLDSINFYLKYNNINKNIAINKNEITPVISKEKYLRRIIQPLESLLLHKKRIIIKDTAVNAICYGAKLSIKGILKYEDGIEKDSEVVLITTKGEAVALCIALITTSEISSLDHGVACKIKRVIMEKDLYPRSWKMGLGEFVFDEEEKILLDKEDGEDLKD